MKSSDFRSRDDIIRLARDRGARVGAEIGVSKGNFSEKMFSIIPELKLYAIDPYTFYKGNSRQGFQDKHDERLQIATERFKKLNVVQMVKTSLEASLEIEDNSLDFVFIDGNHTYDYTMMDLILWTPKVKKGGIVSGHDHYKFRGCGVVEAVRDYTRMHNVKYNLTTGKPEEGIHFSKEERVPSFWWIKRWI